MATITYPTPHPLPSPHSCTGRPLEAATKERNNNNNKDGATGCGGGGRGERRNTSETGTTRLDAVSPAEARKKNYGRWVRVLRFGGSRGLRGKVGRLRPHRDGDDADDGGVTDKNDEEILGFRVRVLGLRWCKGA
jgi:hypothetical protein